MKSNFFSVIACTNLFHNQTTYSTGNDSSPQSIAVVDVNNDNKPDIVVANHGTSSVGVLLNAGNGTFLAQTTYSIGATAAPRGLTVADVNNDNQIDIVVASTGTNSVGVLLNAGNGTFLAQTSYSSAGSGARAVTVTDVNNDNQLDIVVANAGTNSVGVLLNRGNGTFLAQTTYSTGATSVPRGLTVADVNNDNQIDIVVANTGTHNVGVLLNAGNGTFLAQTTYTSATSSPRGVTVADVNNDNQIDIVVANAGTHNVGVLFNLGNGTFLAQTTYATGASSSPQSISVVDINSDNKPDIVVANSGKHNVGVLLNTGNGTFLAPITFSTGTASTPQSVGVVDVNSDNKPDIVVANLGTDNVGVFLHC